MKGRNTYKLRKITFDINWPAQTRNRADRTIVPGQTANRAKLGHQKEFKKAKFPNFRNIAYAKRLLHPTRV